MTVEKNEPQRFRKKPVVIEAIRWSGMDGDDLHAVLDFIQDGHGDFEHLPKAPDDPHVYNGIGFTPSDGRLYIPTLEETHAADPGDYIIRGANGEFYPCKPDIFVATYESVAEPTPNAYEDCMKIHVNEVCLDSFEGFCGCFEHGWNTGLCSRDAEIDALRKNLADAQSDIAEEAKDNKLRRVEIDALKAERDQYKEAGEVFAARVYAEREAEREAEIDALRAQIAEHKCSLPDSINESLNSGDGTYRP